MQMNHEYANNGLVFISVSRQVILEGVPDSVTLSKIQETFPDAYNILDFRAFPQAKGYVGREISKPLKSRNKSVAERMIL